MTKQLRKEIERLWKRGEELKDQLIKMRKENEELLGRIKIRIVELEKKNLQLREALERVLRVQPIRSNEGNADIIHLAKALLRIDRIARDALKEKE